MLNKVTLIGRLGADPDVRYMPNGDAVANISLATTQRWKDKRGDKKEQTEWHRVVFFRRLAEVVSEYVRKGGLIYVEGRIRTRKWQDQQGADRYSTEIIAETMQMLDSKGSADGTVPAADSGGASPGGWAGGPAKSSLDDFDDEPF